MRTSHWVPLDQVQGNITPGFRKDYQALILLRFKPAAFAPPLGETAAADEVRAWLADVVPTISSAEEVATYNRLYRLVKQRVAGTPVEKDGGIKRFARSTCVNIAFTAKGLSVLVGGEPWHADAKIETRLEAFWQGMCARDSFTGDSLKDRAEFTIRDAVQRDLLDRDVTIEQQEAQVMHALVIVGADCEADLTREVDRQLGFARDRLLEPDDRRCKSLGNGREHFGFSDGLSQPDPPDPLAGWATDDEQIVAPGEIIRGCEPEPGHAEPDDVPVWERYGSYLVFRQLEQDVERFWRQAERVAGELFGDLVAAAAAVAAAGGEAGENATILLQTETGDPEHPVEPSPGAQYVAALLLGRWRSGATLTPLRDPGTFPRDPALGQRASGAMAWLGARDLAQDPKGATCPMFAHIRRANPRVPTSTVQQDGLRLHRIVRRGIPYKIDNAKGLMFLAYQARINQQYEVVQRHWINNQMFGGTEGGIEEPGYDALSVVTADRIRNQMLDPLGRGGAADNPAVLSFIVLRTITARGGGYFFAPSLKVLEMLAGEGFRFLK
jgi:Dyp-type peroxidase family